MNTETSATTNRTTGRRIVTEDPWAELRQFTDARISLGRCGVSLPLAESLSFRLAHAQARDAVLQPFAMQDMAAELQEHGYPALLLESEVADRGEFLTRPDKGRRLSAASQERLRGLGRESQGADVCVVISNGLSSRAVHENAVPFTLQFLDSLRYGGLSASPVCLVDHGRVAVGDGVAELLQARLVVMLIGERPGLSSPNSLGVYMTFAPRVGLTDEARNCISNVRNGGMSIDMGVRKLSYLVENAFAMGLSGVQLKDKMPSSYLPFRSQPELG